MSHTVHAIIAVIESAFPDATPAATPAGGGAPIFSDPPASAPPELAQLGARVFGFMKVVGGIVGVIMFGFASIKVMMGKSQRQHMAAEGMHNAVWVIGGLGGLLMAIPIVAFFADL
ncbi:hypothetical protein ABZ897_55240 [Nonomuraea sp. NPDC046802]|uniref:hypothetical protein n=1 Tax=Nonomuraea sp. NPDC046802 TaxID=3154919 RepID=UPI0033D7B276